MSNHLETPVESPPPPLGVGVTLLRLTLIGLALAAIAGTFAYLGGWFNPNELTPARFADGFEQADGLHPGYIPAAVNCLVIEPISKIVSGVFFCFSATFR